MLARTPEDCDRLFAVCVEAADLDGLSALYEPGARLLQRDGSVATGRAEIRQALHALTTGSTEIRIHIVRVVAGDDLAVLYNNWVIRTIAADGRVSERTGNAIEIVRRQQDGRWLFAIDDPFGRSLESAASDAT
jgi:uncharacterized protein (TIGR02246 family)